MSASLLLGDSYVDTIKNNARLNEDNMGALVDAEYAQKSVVRVYIFYETLSFTESTETASKGSPLSLAANIGGILSLFLGVSVLSAFEMVELLIEIYFLSTIT